MNTINKIDSIDKLLEKLRERSEKLFFYGSTALSIYNRRPVKLYRVLTDLNIADIGALLPGVNFVPGLWSDCLYKLADGTTVLFLCREIEESDDYSYLERVRASGGESPLFDMVYRPDEERFFRLGTLYDRRKKEMAPLDSYGLEEEELFDMALLCSELNSYPAQVSGSEREYDIDIAVYKPFIEDLLTSSNPYRALKLLEELGMLSELFPFLEDMKGVEQDRLLHPEGDVYQHTLHCFRFVKSPSLRLALGLLLHDYGKTDRRQKNFSQHATLGADAVSRLLKPYGYGEPLISEVRFLVEHHMVNSFYYRINQRTKKDVFNSPLGVELMRLYKADTQGSIGKLDIYHEIYSGLKRDKSIKAF